MILHSICITKLNAEALNPSAANYELFDIELSDRTRILESIDVLSYQGDFYLPVNFISSSLELNLNFNPEKTILAGKINGQVLALDFKQLKQYHYFITSEDLWLNVKDFADLIDASIQLDFSALLFSFKANTDVFPIQKRIARAKRSVVSQSRNTEPNFEFVIPDKYRLYTPPKGAVRLNLNQSDNTDLGYQYNLHSYNDILYHSANINLSQVKGDDLNARMTFSRFKPSPNQSLFAGLSQYQFGDVTVNNNRAGVAYSGVGFTFSSLERRYTNYYGAITLEEFAPANWQAELYSNGYLIQTGQVSTDGLIKFEQVETSYGVNRFEIKLYGEFGEEDTIVREIIIGGNQLKVGSFNYTGGVFDTRHSMFNDSSIFNREESSNLAGYIQTEYGLSSSTTLGLSIFQQQATASASANAEYILSLTQQLNNALLDVNLKHQGESGYGAELDLLGSLFSNSIRYQLGARRLSQYQSLNSISNNDEIRTDFSASFSGRFKKLAWLISGNQSQVEQTDSSLNNMTRYDSLATRLSWRYRRFNFTNVTRYRYGPDTNSVTDDIAISTRLTDDINFRALASFDLKPNAGQSHFDSARLNLNWRISPKLNNQTSLQANKGDHYNLTSYLSWQRDDYNLTMSAQADNQSHWQVALGISFNLDWDYHKDQIDINYGYSPASGTLDLFNFIDHNQNAIYDRSDEVIENLKFGGKKQWIDKVSGENGAVYLTGLTSQVPTQIYVNAHDTKASNLTPIYADFKVFSHPGGIIDLDLPYNYAAELIGQLEFELDDSSYKPQYLPIELVRDGKVVKTSYSEFDHVFIFDKVWPGYYQVRIEQSFLHEKGLISVPEFIDVKIDGSRDLVELASFSLQRLDVEQVEQALEIVAPSTTELISAKPPAKHSVQQPIKRSVQNNLTEVTILKQNEHVNSHAIYAIQLAAAQSNTSCEAIKRKEQAEFSLPVFVIRNHAWCRVYLGRFNSHQQAKLILEQLGAKKPAGAYVKKI
ncbi:hypothetical protein [Catenovulum maritimum]|uniref:SPOR domain-containing protein n=1 Tax=Catenovulum maritimum TaxID=1513271 RepID=A0A0J8GZB0_9ALTE|nr:hypothetical protein [Catenovulum maritimum]KMT66569.1 hypothetical protein XM47_03290 [Catenovulum maritimum]